MKKIIMLVGMLSLNSSGMHHEQPVKECDKQAEEALQELAQPHSYKSAKQPQNERFYKADPARQTGTKKRLFPLPKKNK